MNSKLVCVSKLTQNHSGKRKHEIDTITPHVYCGDVPVESMLTYFLNPSVKASCNYCIDSKGKVGLCVEEENRAWTSSNGENDNRAITFEIANDGDAKTGYHMTDNAINSVIALCVDICVRYGKTEIYFDSNKNKAHRGNNTMRITLHRWFKNKECPGNYFISKIPYICSEVNKQLNTTDKKIYRVQLGAFKSKENAVRLQKELKEKGYDCIIV